MVGKRTRAGKGICGAPGCPVVRGASRRGAGRGRIRPLGVGGLVVAAFVLAAGLAVAAPHGVPEARAGRGGGPWRAVARAPTVAPTGSRRTLWVAVTGSLKGWITSTTLYPQQRPTGLAYLAPVVRHLRTKHPALILLDAGDALEGAPSATLGARGGLPPMLALMNALGYDAMTLGNVDAALGWPMLDAARAASGFAWLSANAVRRDAAGRDVPRLPPYVVLERRGVRVGVLGLTTPAAMLGRNPRTLGGVTFRDAEAAARHWVPVLRKVEHVDVLIGLFHSGPDGDYERDVALRTGLPLFAAAGRIAEDHLGFDLVVAGDALRLRPRAPAGGDTPYGTPMVQPGARGDGLAVATLHLVSQGGRWAVRSVQRRTLRAASALDPGSLVLEADILRRTRRRLAAPTAVRFLAVPRRSEFQRYAGALGQAAAVRLAARLSGAAMRPLLSLLPIWDFWPPARGEIGQPLRRAHLFRWLRFDEPLVQGRLTGRQVALLLDGYMRWSHRWRVPRGDVLWPGGLQVTLVPHGSQIAGLRRMVDGGSLREATRVPVWLTAYHWYGGGGLAARALLSGNPPLRASTSGLRSALFSLLSDRAFPVPGVCARWLGH